MFLGLQYGVEEVEFEMSCITIKGPSTCSDVIASYIVAVLASISENLSQVSTFSLWD